MNRFCLKKFWKYMLQNSTQNWKTPDLRWTVKISRRPLEEQCVRRVLRTILREARQAERPRKKILKIDVLFWFSIKFLVKFEKNPNFSKFWFFNFFASPRASAQLWSVSGIFCFFSSFDIRSLHLKCQT